MRTMNIFGLRRSGNHAITEWIAGHFAHALHHNDCVGWGEAAVANCEAEYGDVSQAVGPGNPVV